MCHDIKGMCPYQNIIAEHQSRNADLIEIGSELVTGTKQLPVLKKKLQYMEIIGLFLFYHIR